MIAFDIAHIFMGCPWFSSNLRALGSLGVFLMESRHTSNASTTRVFMSYFSFAKSKNRGRGNQAECNGLCRKVSYTDMRVSQLSLLERGQQMNVSTILEQIDEEISRLKQARALLTDEPVKKAVGRPKKAAIAIAVKPKRRKLSAAG
jgi:hypothetical protein